MTDRAFDVVEPPFGADREVRVAGVVLAAGTSSRFGEANKLLATVDGRPLVRHAVETLLDAGLDEVIAVVGYESDAVRDAIDDLPVAVVENEDYAEGQATSVRRGIVAVSKGADAAVSKGANAAVSKGADAAEAAGAVDGVLFALGDMPDVRPETVAALVAAFAAGAGDPLAAAFEGQRGNPVLFGRQYFDRLAAVDGDVGGREILRTAERTALVETGDPGVRRDVDRRDDLTDS